jgi:GNAT superfamily N-acetyltransferase
MFKRKIERINLIKRVCMSSNNIGSIRSKTILVLELGLSHIEMMRLHLLGLGDIDRRLRFGMYVTNDFINKYVDSFMFDRDCFFGVFDESLKLIGLAHLAYGKEPLSQRHVAEFGVSVSKNGRGFGVGTALFQRSAIHARNTNITVLYVHCLASNAAMMHIARKAGMAVEYSYGDADAYLRLPPGDPSSAMIEAIQAHSAAVDYSFKKSFQRSRLNNQLLLTGRPLLGQ